MESAPLLGVANARTRKSVVAAGIALCGAAGLVALAASAGSARPTSLAFKLPPFPVEHFSWKDEAPTDPPCDSNGCAWRDEVFTVDNWDQLCIQHCGEIDAMLKDVVGRQRSGVVLANRGRVQSLAGLDESRMMSGPELLQNAGVNLNTWGLEEHEMPEQEPEQPEENVVVATWNKYWDSGKKLRDSGVNINQGPAIGADINPSDGAPMREDGVVLDSWPWQAGAREQHEGGGLPGVHTNGWNGEAFRHASSGR